jgi:hypothetical protein
LADQIPTRVEDKFSDNPYKSYNMMNFKGRIRDISDLVDVSGHKRIVAQNINGVARNVSLCALSAQPPNKRGLATTTVADKQDRSLWKSASLRAVSQ